MALPDKMRTAGIGLILAVCACAPATAGVSGPDSGGVVRTGSPGAGAPPAPALDLRRQGPSSGPVVVDDLASHAAARARMLECGHRWSAMKKAGTAMGTWKEFSQTCLGRN